MKEMRVYLAGPMSGLESFNYPAFTKAAAVLRQLGYVVVNPAENFLGDTKLPRNTYLTKAFVQVTEVDAVAVLAGWALSDGASTEVAIAHALDIPVFNFPGGSRIARLASKHPHGTLAGMKKAMKGSDPVTTGVWCCGGTNCPGTYPTCPLASKPPETEPLKERHPVPLRGPHVTSHPNATASPPSMPTPPTLKVRDFSGLVDGGGYKGSMDDPAKLPLWLVPNALVLAAARVLQHGAKKYAPNNWRRGMKYSEVYSALQRHLTAWLEGEDNDDDSHLNHLDHAAACLSFLLEYVANPGLYEKYDDRFKRPLEESA